MIFEPNLLYFKMASAIANKKPDSKLIIVNEGSSRSSKTYDTIHLIAAICDQHRGKKLDIYFFRDSLVNCKEALLKDFTKCLTLMGIWDDKNLKDNNGKPNYMLFGQTIKFRGLDDNSLQVKEGSDSDIIFFNEILSGCDEDRVKGWVMRCNYLIIADYNPRYTDHWVFNWEKRNDCVFLHSTYKQNRHLPKEVIKEIEQYNPDMPENVSNGTADVFRWKVYGLGERANKEGLVFPHVTWVDSFPTDIEEISFGMDFGETAQTAIVKVGVKRNPIKNDIYLQKLFYLPTENSNIIAEVLTELSKKQVIDHIWCDSNQPGWVGDLRRAGFRALITKKFPGSREYWIATLKKFNIHIVRDIDFRKEQENFCYRVVDGIQLSETIKKYDHLWSASGYSCVGDFRIEK